MNTHETPTTQTAMSKCQLSAVTLMDAGTEPTVAAFLDALGAV